MPTTFDMLERERDHYRNKCNRLDEARRFALADRDRCKEDLDKAHKMIERCQKERERLSVQRDQLYERILEVDVKLKVLKERHAEELKRKDEQIAHWQEKYKNKIYAND